MDAHSSDLFYKSAEAQAAYKEAMAFDSGAAAPSLVFTAHLLIKCGDIPKRHKPVSYALNFLSRVQQDEPNSN